MIALIWHLRFALLLTARPYRWGFAEAWHYARLSWAVEAECWLQHRGARPFPSPRQSLASDIGLRR